MFGVFLIAFLIPILLLIVGFVLKNKCSHYPDLSCGYHVGKLASKNEKVWKDANSYSGTQFIMHGTIVTVFDVMVLIYSINTIKGPLNEYLWWAISIIIYIGLTCIIPVAMAIICTQLHLNKIFNKDGSKKR